VTPFDTNEHADEIERFGLHLSSESLTSVTKRKTPDHDDLSPDHKTDHKRVCIESVLPNLDTLSLVDDSDTRETSTPKTTENEDQLSLTTRLTTGGLTALSVPAINTLLQSTSSSDVGAPQSMSICGSSIGSLFGRPSTHVHELWMTWSPTFTAPASVRSLRSVGIAAPMLESADEELLHSRVVIDSDEPRYRYRWTIEALLKGHSSDLNTDHQDPHAPRGVSCLFGFLGCFLIFTDFDEWIEHCKKHLRGQAPPRQLRCPYSSCEWATSRQDGEDAWHDRRRHLHRVHDILSQSEEMRKEPDISFKYLWSVRILNDVQFQELRKFGQLGSDGAREW
jgi:hypothetical protein